MSDLPTAASRLRVLTLNTWGLPFPLAWSPRAPRFRRIDQLLHTGAYDLVALQEVWDRAHRLLPSRPLLRPPAHHGDSGLALHTPHAVDGDLTHSFTTATGMDRLKRKGVHARRVRLAGGTGTWFAVTHLQAGHGRSAADARARQVDELLAVVERLDGPAILAGDFNLYDGHAVDACSADRLAAAGLLDVGAGGAAEPTHAASGQRFDRVYVRQGAGARVSVDAVRVLRRPGEKALSDHAALEVELAVEPTR